MGGKTAFEMLIGALKGLFLGPSHLALYFPYKPLTKREEARRGKRGAKAPITKRLKFNQQSNFVQSRCEALCYKAASPPSPSLLIHIFPEPLAAIEEAPFLSIDRQRRR